MAKPFGLEEKIGHLLASKLLFVSLWYYNKDILIDCGPPEETKNRETKIIYENSIKISNKYL